MRLGFVLECVLLYKQIKMPSEVAVNSEGGVADKERLAVLIS